MALSLGLLTRMAVIHYPEIRDAVSRLLTQSWRLVLGTLVLETVWLFSLANVYRTFLRALGGTLGRRQAVRVARWYRPFLKQMGGLGVIGLDESTGLVGRVGSMQVLGAGSVTIATTHGADVYRAGCIVDLDLTVPTSPPPLHPIFESLELAGKESPIPISSRSSSPQSLPVGAMSSPRW